MSNQEIGVFSRRIYFTRSAYQISSISTDSRLGRSKIRFTRICDCLPVRRRSQITRDISFSDGSDDGHEERVRGKQARSASAGDHTCLAQPRRNNRTLQLWPRPLPSRALSPLSVSPPTALRPRRPMSSRRRCASSRCPPVPTRARARRRHRFRARTRGRGVARTRGDPGGSRAHREPRRRVIDAPTTGIARRARLGRGRPRSVRVSHDCFLHQPGNSRRGVCPSARLSLTPPRPRARSAGFLRALGGPLRQA